MDYAALIRQAAFEPNPNGSTRTAAESVSQARLSRQQLIMGWCGSQAGDRGDGDDGRALRLNEFQFWPDQIKEAEEEFFALVDAAYEVVKAEALA